MVLEHAVTDVKGLIADENAQQLPVGHIDEGLARLRRSVLGLRERQGSQFVESIQIRARQPVGLPLVKVAPQTEVAIGQRKERFGLRQEVEVQFGFVEGP